MTTTTSPTNSDNLPRLGGVASRQLGSDYRSYTVIEISKSGHRVTLQERRRFRCDGNGMSEAQRYLTTDDPHGEVIVATRRKDGEYRERGCSYYGRVVFNREINFHDYCR